MSAAVSLHPDDGVVVALRDWKDGETCGVPGAEGGLASGEIRTNGERNGYKEIAIFKDGVIL